MAAGFTQEELAERAGLSARGIADLERGTRKSPYAETVERLCSALRLGPDERDRLLAARRRAVSNAEPIVSLPASLSGDGLRVHNLPIPTTTFVARAGEREQVLQRLREARLLTITGAGGCGKTRLAMEIAGQVVDEFADGVWLVDLAPLVDASLVPQTVATTVGLRDIPHRAPLDALTDHLRIRRTLLVLDNCEHVVNAAARAVDEILRVCANVKILATSRELLAVAGEATWRVGSLSVPALDTLTGMQDGLARVVLASESGQLFADRAQLVAPSFTVTDRNALAVAQVCQRLDGIPLAIELAAARLNMLSVAQITARLDHRFRLLIGGRRTAVRRQQTLQATVDWSYELLSEPERSLVRRLSVFAGGWSLEAAEAVAGDAESGGQDVLDLLGHLVTRSMVLVEEPSDEAEVVRYRFLETIRQYAEQKLLDDGEADRVRTRHRDWYLNLAEQAVDGMVGDHQKEWWQRLEREHDNLRAALAWSASYPAGAPQLLRLAGSLGAFWQARGYAREGIAWLEMALSRNDGPPSAARARALNWRGQLEVVSGNAAAGRRFLERSIAEARAVGDDRVLSIALRYLGFATGRPEERATARRLFEEALAVSRAGGWQREIAWNLSLLGRTLALAGELEAAEELLQEGLAIGRLSGDSTAVIVAMEHLGVVYGRRGDVARARQILREAAELGQAVEVKYLAAGARLMLGDLGMAEQHWDAAERDYRAALEAARLGATRGLIAPVGRRFAGLCQARGDHHRAVRLLSAFASITDPWDSAIYFEAVASEDEILATARKALGENEFAAAVAAGKSLTLEQAVADALH